MPDDVIRVASLMRTEFRRVRADQTLGEAMAALREAKRGRNMPNALMVVDSEDRFVGLLTAKLLIRILVGSRRAGQVGAESGGDRGREREDDESGDVRLLEVAQRRLAERVGDALILDVPVVAPQDRLLDVIRRGVATRLDFVPVVDDGRPVGLVPITVAFQAAAGIALTPEHEGIRFDR